MNSPPHPTARVVDHSTASRATAQQAAELRIAVLRTARRIRRERADDDISPAALSVLFTLEREGPLPPGELAAQENVRPPSMTRTVAALEEAGLVTRTPHPDDRRQVLVTTTAAGRAMVAETKRRRTAWLACRLEALSRDERATLAAAAEILGRVASS